MSLYLRALPSLSLKLRPFYLKPSVPLFYLNKFFKPISIIPSRSLSITAAASPDTLIPVSKKPIDDSLLWVSRTGLCGDLSENDVGKRVCLCGWVALHRIHGGLSFLNLRDHSGIIQVYLCVCVLLIK